MVLFYRHVWGIFTPSNFRCPRKVCKLEVGTVSCLQEASQSMDVRSLLFPMYSLGRFP